MTPQYKSLRTFPIGEYPEISRWEETAIFTGRPTIPTALKDSFVLTRKVALQTNVRRTLSYLDDELDESLCEEMEKAHRRLQAL